MDLFRCESATLRAHRILVVMDPFTRRIIGFGVHAGAVDGLAACRMFHLASRGCPGMPKPLSCDHDPLFLLERWRANLRILDVAEIKTAPCVPPSHPFAERLIGTVRREFLDRTLFRTTQDLENKLLEFQDYCNMHRAHISLQGQAPDQYSSGARPRAGIDVLGKVFVWIRLPQPLSYYTDANSGMGENYPRNAQGMARDAVQAALSQGVDFTPYDVLGEGSVTALFIIHAGSGAEATGGREDIWSHKWVIPGGVLVDGNHDSGQGRGWGGSDGHRREGSVTGRRRCLRRTCALETGVDEMINEHATKTETGDAQGCAAYDCAGPGRARGPKLHWFFKPKHPGGGERSGMR